MEAYIEKCISSLIIPEFSDVEVLVVNDGSKDRSSLLAHSFEMKYPESIRVIDKPNGNYGSCINAALPLASARYVKILDADDTFSTDDFSELVKELPKLDDDLILTSFVVVDENNNETRRNSIKNWGEPIDVSISGNDLFRILSSNFAAMHNIIYNRRIFERLHYSQSEGISYTDSEWATIPISYCRSLRFKDIYLYRYLIGREGQTMDPVQYINRYDHVIKVLDKISQTSKEDRNNELLFIRALRFHAIGYYEASRYNSERIMNLIRDYDEKLAIKNPDLYKAMYNFSLYPGSSYSFIRHLRQKGYPKNLKLSLFSRVGIYVSRKINKLRSFSR